jgi:hypothetical protein
LVLNTSHLHQKNSIRGKKGETETRKEESERGEKERRREGGKERRV